MEVAFKLRQPPPTWGLFDVCPMDPPEHERGQYSVMAPPKHESGQYNVMGVRTNINRQRL